MSGRKAATSGSGYPACRCAHADYLTFQEINNLVDGAPIQPSDSSSEAASESAGAEELAT
jgi:hypothetical protein